VAAGALSPAAADGADVLAVADARNGEVMAARYRLAPDGRVVEVDPPALMALADAARRVVDGDVVAGPKAAAVAELAFARPAHVVPLEPEAAAFARVAWQSANPPVPLYSRPPDAKPQADTALPRATP
jgi:tRNA A37 threonylcarbamoyladenosine modification protein TsaB